MVDVVAPATRSRMMAGIKGKNTKPELLIRKLLFAKGFRYRLHAKDLPGKPDLVFPCHRAVVFIHGCFWHRHDCHLFKWPKSREDFWRKKILGNVRNDSRALKKLLAEGWRACEIWECALKGKKSLQIDAVETSLVNWLTGKRKTLVLRSSR